MRKFLILIIKIYQQTLSPDHSWLKSRWPHGFCRFYPSCSQYGVESIEKYGIIKGSIITGKRILRCNPFTEPSVDQVPKL